jgi:hypothetical protein
MILPNRQAHINVHPPAGRDCRRLTVEVVVTL